MMNVRVCCLVLMWISLGDTILIVGPYSIRPNRDYTVTICNPINETINGTLLLYIQGQDFDGRPLLNLTNTVSVQTDIKQMITFKIPSNITEGNYRIIMDGKRDFNFSQQYSLTYRNASLLGFIQLNKLFCAPGDKLMFRVIVLDVDLKPPLSNETTVSVYVKDPNGEVLRHWSNVSLYSGVFVNQIAISPIPERGEYQIYVEANGKYLVSKQFGVAEYKLYSIELDIDTTVLPLLEHQALNLTVNVKNYLGKPVSGSVNIDIYLNERKSKTSGKWNVNGMRTLYLPFVDKINFTGPEGEVALFATFSPQDSTYNQAVKLMFITVYKYRYKVWLEHRAATYYPGSPFTGTLQVAYRNNEPAKNATLRVRVEGLNETHEKSYTSNKDGHIFFSFDTTTSSQLNTLTVYEDDHELLRHMMIKVKHSIQTTLSLQLKLLTRVKFNRMVRFMVTCSHGMHTLLYYIVAKGNIVEFGSFNPNQMTRYTFQVLMSDKLIPRSRIIVFVLTNGVLQIRALDLSINDLGNPLEIKIEENISEDGVDPGDEIELSIRSRPGAFVSLAAYDQRLLLYSKHHDIFLDDIWKFFDSFYVTDGKNYDLMEQLGIFGRSFNATTTKTENEYASRGILPDAPRFGMPGPYRVDLWESWLWQNLTIPASGRSQLVTTVPHTATSWYITGFSIDPVYGLGVVKKPIQFSTFKIIFILDHLPRAIRRGETVSLHFNLINNLSDEFEATVTMFNVMNQIRFVDLPSDATTETKRVYVPPKSDIPVSFVIEAMKIGEMEIRVNASVLEGVITDSLRKIVEVLPETVAFQETKRALIACDSSLYELEHLHLALPENAEVETVTVNVTYYPLTSEQKLFLTLTNESLEDMDLTHYHYYNMSDLKLRYHRGSRKVLVNVAVEQNNPNNSSSCGGVIQVNWQYLISVDLLSPRFSLSVTKQATPVELLRQFEICCSFIPEHGIDHSNGTLVEVSIPIGYAMDDHSALETTIVNSINRTEVLHGGTTLRLFYNDLGTERNCFIVFVYRRYPMPIRHPVYILVKDSYHPEFSAFNVYDIY